MDKFRAFLLQYMRLIPRLIHHSNYAIRDEEKISFRNGKSPACDLFYICALLVPSLESNKLFCSLPAEYDIALEQKAYDIHEVEDFEKEIVYV